MDGNTASDPGQQSGFTLIELVVTITLMGIVLASTALLGRHAVDPIRDMSRFTGLSIHIQDCAYFIRRIDEIAVLLSWSDTTLCYLDEQGKRRKLDLTRSSPDGKNTAHRVVLEISTVEAGRTAILLKSAGLHDRMWSPEPFIIRLSIPSVASLGDTLHITRRVLLRRP